MMGEFDYRNEVTVDVLGRIFERSISDIEEIKAKSLDQHAATLADRRRKPGRRKEQGVYYTADYIVNYLVSAALDPLWEQTRTDLAKEHGVDLTSTAPPSGSFLTAMLRWLDTVTLCDPACGSGAFLIAAYDWFLNRRLSLLDDLSHVEPGDPESAGRHDDWIERSGAPHPPEQPLRRGHLPRIRRDRPALPLDPHRPPRPAPDRSVGPYPLWQQRRG